MPLRIYKNRHTGEEIRTLKVRDPKDWEEVLVPPAQKFMVTANAATGTSKLKDQDKILKERSRNHARNVDIDDTIQLNKANGLDASVATNLLNEKGLKRTKLDDI